jgi:hypothetical protein
MDLKRSTYLTATVSFYTLRDRATLIWRAQNVFSWTAPMRSGASSMRLHLCFSIKVVFVAVRGTLSITLYRMDALLASDWDWLKTSIGATNCFFATTRIPCGVLLHIENTWGWVHYPSVSCEEGISVNSVSWYVLNVCMPIWFMYFICAFAD